MNAKYIIGAVVVLGLLALMIKTRLEKIEAARAARTYMPAPFGSTSTMPTNTASLPATTNQPAAVGSPAQPTASGNPAVNPPHGSPGHRCDIAVGAPLPGSSQTASAAPASTQIFTPQPQTATAAATSSPSTPKPKLNPAHGQPWHRCDIQVGAPLT